MINDEPIKDLLGNIDSSLVDNLVECVYDGGTSKIPTFYYLGAKPKALPGLTGIETVKAGNEIAYRLDEDLPVSWLRTLLTSSTVIHTLTTSFVVSSHSLS